MDLFPIGTVAASSNKGTIEGVSYSMFEPNSKVSSRPIFSTLVTRFENVSMATRKKAEPILTLSCAYDGIFTREYRQLQHFIDFVEAELNSFFIVDLSQGLSPSSVTTVSNWVANIDNTRLFSTITNKKANYVFFWNALSWKIGQVSTVTANTSLTCDVSDDLGAMTAAQAAVVTGNLKTLIYPMYEVFISGGLDSFKQVEFIDETINLTNDGGATYSGELSFTSRYKV